MQKAKSAICNLKSSKEEPAIRNPQAEIGWLGWFGDGGEQTHQRGAGLRRVVLGLCLGLVLWLAGASGAMAETPWLILIRTDTIWSLAGSPYIIGQNIEVQEGAALTIEPGVEVKFDGNYHLKVLGTLIAKGTADNLITFTSNKAEPVRGCCL